MVWYSHLFKSVKDFVVVHTVKIFGIVKAFDCVDHNKLENSE